MDRGQNHASGSNVRGDTGCDVSVVAQHATCLGNAMRSLRENHVNERIHCAYRGFLPQFQISVISNGASQLQSPYWMDCTFLS
mmetsp:Transcript_23623/g.54990  ORF Transcript_23623/g.54990 Transcript_23623/m.54990 type:complete len:83 (-) Transcript_23623:230-478(-)